jgi:D-ribulokinase
VIDVALGIDVGTSGVRIAARDRMGTLKAMASAPLEGPILEFGRSLQDPQLWWQAVVSAFSALDLRDLNVVAMAIDGTSGTIVPVDGNGTPVAMASMYNDVAEPQQVAHIKSLAPPETAAHGVTSPLARLIPMLPSAVRILHQADWLLGQFCGRYDVSDENNALKTGYDPVTRQWPPWISRLDVALSQLPDVVAAGTRVGTILPDVAKVLGLPREVAVVTGTTDGCAGFLASGAQEAGDGVTSLGTTVTLKLLSAAPVFAPQYGIYSHRIGETWLAGGASNSGGAVLKQFFTNDDITRLTALMDSGVETGLDYHPLPQPGERFPINDPGLKPRLAPRPADDHVFLQAMFEGMADIEALGYRRLAELGASPLKSIRSAGGGAANAVWTAIRMKRLGVPALASASDQAAMGTARLAWRGVGHDA